MNLGVKLILNQPITERVRESSAPKNNGRMRDPASKRGRGGEETPYRVGGRNTTILAVNTLKTEQTESG